MNTEQ
jgi:hypothetical protein